MTEEASDDAYEWSKEGLQRLYEQMTMWRSVFHFDREWLLISLQHRDLAAWELIISFNSEDDNVFFNRRWPTLHWAVGGAYEGNFFLRIGHWHLTNIDHEGEELP